MFAFDQKPRFASRPLEWLTSGGHATRNAAERFLNRLRRQLEDDDAEPLRLVSLRDDFRKLMAHDEVIPVLQRRLRYGGPLYRAVSIWLLSKNASRFDRLGIDHHSDDASPLVRKHVAKALRQLEAWDVLRDMAHRHLNDADVLPFVEPKPNRKSYTDRLAGYTD